jgi:urease accessory protein
MIPIAAQQLRGSAELRFVRRGGRTVLAHSRIEAPMTVIRPFELLDGRLVVQLITLGPGLCGGDAIHIAVTAEDGARLVITTTAATRVMSMEPGEHAEQHVVLHAGLDASVEYYPAVTIPFPGSALVQTVQVTAVPTSRIAVIETWAMGRAARGEYLRFRSLSSRTTLSVDGRLTYADAMHLEPGGADVANVGVLAGRAYVAAGFWHGATVDADIGAGPERRQGACPEHRRGVEPVTGGTLAAFAQSTPQIAYLRALGDDGPALETVLRRSVEQVSAGWGVPAVHMDRFRC